ncbi:lasso RiPP family leader peptide-containing protein [Dyadobacter sandarakinus]|uniref:Lasso RiPP family leader peptide-containing protein n=1 Tax=Dyadobacter sandarakinus TaxID=2747268 RepID=A0ABX7ID88_9BACT|nr:lasso RiPP family leader peptide-containing protein [Dyadobacter sandarakinus]
MRTVTAHSTQTKKSYVKPALVKHGKVSKLTKGKQGSSLDDDGGEFNYTADA